MIARLVPGFTYSEGDYPGEAMPTLERGYALAVSLDVPYFILVAASGLALAYARAGRTNEAVQLARLGAEIAGSSRSWWGSGRMAVIRGEALLTAGCVDEAREQAAFAMETSKARRERGSEAYTRWLLAEIAVARGPADPHEAEARYREALALTEELEMRPLQARCHLGLGKLYRRIGRLDESRAELATAVAMLREMGMAFWLPEAERELAGRVDSACAISLTVTMPWR